MPFFLARSHRWPALHHLDEEQRNQAQPQRQTRSQQFPSHIPVSIRHWPIAGSTVSLPHCCVGVHCKYLHAHCHPKVSDGEKKDRAIPGVKTTCRDNCAGKHQLLQMETYKRQKQKRAIGTPYFLIFLTESHELALQVENILLRPWLGY